MLTLAAADLRTPARQHRGARDSRGAARHDRVHAVRVLPRSAGDGVQAGVHREQFIVAGIAIVGGLYFPIAVLPGWIRWASEVQPFTPATDLLRHLLVDTPLVHPAIVELLKLVGFTAVLLPSRRAASARVDSLRSAHWNRRRVLR